MWNFIFDSAPKKVRGADKKAVWGPRHWAFLHQIAACYPETYVHAKHAQENRRTYNFLKVYYYLMIPCKQCRTSYGDYMSKHDTELKKALASGSVMLQTFMYDLHNYVNDKLGKASGPPFHEVLTTYNCRD